MLSCCVVLSSGQQLPLHSLRLCGACIWRSFCGVCALAKPMATMQWCDGQRRLCSGTCMALSDCLGEITPAAAGAACAPGAACGQRLPLSLASVVAGNCSAWTWCCCGACDRSAAWDCEDCWLAPWPFCGGTATQASCRDSLSRRSAWMGMLSC